MTRLVSINHDLWNDVFYIRAYDGKIFGTPSVSRNKEKLLHPSLWEGRLSANLPKVIGVWRVRAKNYKCWWELNNRARGHP